MKMMPVIFLLLSIGSYAQKATPAIFEPGVISVGDYESHADFSVGGDTLMFVKSNPDVSKWTICFSIRKNGKWSKPEVASFSGQYMDADPYFTPDGKMLLFISNRPIKEGDPPKADMDIWKIEKTKNGWGKPERLSDVVNSDKSEYYPTMLVEGNVGELYFGSRRDGGRGGSDIWKAEFQNGEFKGPFNMGEAINTDGSEFEPYVAPDSKYMIFMAAQPDDLQYADLYISYNMGDFWTKAEKLPEPINSPATEFAPRVTKDGKYFFFASARNINPSTTSKRERMVDVERRARSVGNGLGDIYFVEVKVVVK
jgi:Tol biopolymer transport system component